MTTHGYGTFLHNPELTKIDFTDGGQARKCSFLLKCPERDGKPQTFRFEVWDTAADYIVENARAGDTLHIHESVPRSYTPKEEPDNHKVVFRVGHFSLQRNV